MKRGLDGGGQMGQGPAKRPASGVSNARVAQGQSLSASGNSRLTTNDALTYLREVKVRFQDNKDIYDRFLEIMKEFKAQRINTEGVIWQVKQLFAGHRELILGFNTFLPKGYEITMADVEDEEEEKPNSKPVEFDQAINYVNKIKQRFARDEGVYKAFLEILNMYRKGQKNITSVYEEVASLFRAHMDLLQEFTYFLPDSQANPVNFAHLPAVMRRESGGRGAGRGKGGRGQYGDSGYRNANKRKVARESYGRGRSQDDDRTNLSKELTFFEKVKQRMRNREQYQDFLKCLNMFTEEIITKQELHSLVADALNRHPDLQTGFNEFVARCEAMEFDDPSLLAAGKMSTRDLNKMRHLAGGDKWTTRPVSELDTSSWERVGTSYVKLPPSYPRFICSTRDAALEAVLNNDWVSVTSGSEDYSFKHMRKNQYEEAMFRCEDDRFELDMVMETTASAIKAMVQLSQVLQHATDAEDRASFRLPPNKLNAVHLRAVQRIYGERGPEMVKLLLSNPGVAIPVVLARLQQKDSEWRKVKQDMEPLWAKVYEANYHKSLDHRSFYFKQTDKKTLGAKAMVNEIKERHEARRQRGEGGEVAVAGTNLRLAPDLVFDYRDRVVHDDVYKVLKYAVAQCGSSTEQTNRALSWYRGLLEQFFGLPPRTADQEAAVVTKQEDHIKERPQHRALGRLVQDDGMSGEPSAMDEAELPIDANGEAVSGIPVDPNDPRTRHQKPAGGADPTLKHEIKTEVKLEDMGADTDAPDTDDEDAMQGERRPEKGRVFYANEPFTILFRLHAYLYDRLRQAHKCSQRVVRPIGRAREEPEPAAGGGEVAAQDDEAARRVHAQFMQMVLQLIDGRMDSSQYEDSCRALLGTNSYMLFTLDKLIAKVVKQLQVLMADDLCAKLFDLYRYEAARSTPLSDALYSSNAHVLLHDDACYRLESLPSGDMTVQLLEQNKTEVPASIIHPPFAEYLRSFVNQSSNFDVLEKDGDLSRRPFLLRTLPARSPAALEDRLGAMLQHTTIVNGLECKVATDSSKVSYVLDTSDAFQRFRPGPPPDLSHETAQRGAARQRHERFTAWVDARARVNQQVAAMQAQAQAAVPMAASQAGLDALQAVAAVM